MVKDWNMYDRNLPVKNTLLKTGDRLLLRAPGDVSAHSRVKRISSDGYLQVTYAGKERLAQGDEVQVRSKDGDAQKIYYMQVKDGGTYAHPYMLLQRNPGRNLNKRRRAWRVSYTSTTGIRGHAEHHFRSAVFCDLSLTSARIASECQFPPETAVVVHLALPEFPVHDIPARVIRTSSTPIGTDSFGQELFGLVIVFEGMSRQAARHLTYFLWSHIRKNYTQQMRFLYDIGHSKQYGD